MSRIARVARHEVSRSARVFDLYMAFRRERRMGACRYALYVYDARRKVAA